MSFQIESNHWLLGSKSFLNNEHKVYCVGLEATIQHAFLDTQIKETTLWKTMIPRYYKGITRKQEVFMYNPMVEVKDRQLTFTMRDNDRFNKGYWQLTFNENVFDFSSNFEEGLVFVDFNSDFIAQIRSLRKDDITSLQIDHTGLYYGNNESTFHLPHEDRGTLIELLKQVKSEFGCPADYEIDIPIEQIWNQAIQRKALTDPTPYKEDRGFISLFDTPEKKGEFYNPFYCLALTKTLHNRSNVAKQFDKEATLRYYEDQDEYQLELPLKEELGKMEFRINGRKNSNWRRF